MDTSDKLVSLRSLFDSYSFLEKRCSSVSQFIDHYSSRSHCNVLPMVTIFWGDDSLSFPVSYEVLLSSLQSYHDELSLSLNKMSDFINSIPDYDK